MLLLLLSTDLQVHTESFLSVARSAVGSSVWHGHWYVESWLYTCWNACWWTTVCWLQWGMWTTVALSFSWILWQTKPAVSHMCGQSVHYVRNYGIYSDQSKHNLKDHYGDATTEQRLCMIAEINAAMQLVLIGTPLHFLPPQWHQ